MEIALLLSLTLLTKLQLSHPFSTVQKQRQKRYRQRQEE
jgi:hypothetical protein